MIPYSYLLQGLTQGIGLDRMHFISILIHNTFEDEIG